MSPFVIVTHVGRSTGRPYSTPLAGFQTPTGIVLTPTYGPSADWVQNVVAEGALTVDRRGEVWHLQNVRLIGRTEAWPALPRLVRVAMRILRIETFVSADYL